MAKKTTKSKCCRSAKTGRFMKGHKADCTRPKCPRKSTKGKKKGSKAGSRKRNALGQFK